MKEVAKKTITREQYEVALAAFVANDNKARLLAAERDKKLEPINKEYDPQFEKLHKASEELFDTMHQYCEDNRKTMFADAKSVEELGAKVGFREGKYKVVVLDGFEEKDIVATMMKRKAWLTFVKSTPSMDKVQLIKVKPKGMGKLGFKVVKEETFFATAITTEE